MGKFHGYIGFTEQYELRPGVWDDRIVEKECFGNTLSASFMNTSSSEVNDNLKLDNRISIIGNTYTLENFRFMKYITYMGVKWAITKVDVQYPRLVLTIGGVYNAQQT